MRNAIKIVNAIIDCEKPTIAKVQGTAAGIGCHLAFACDLVVAPRQREVHRGVRPAGAGRRRLGVMAPAASRRPPAAPRSWSSSPTTCPAQRALEIGLATRVVPAEELDKEVEVLARRLADGPTKAHMVNKWLLNRSFDVDRNTLAGDEAWMVDVMGNTADSEEGVASFKERRPPRFRGF